MTRDQAKRASATVSVRLDDLAGEAPALDGHKAATLAVLRRAGFEVAVQGKVRSPALWLSPTPQERNPGVEIPFRPLWSAGTVPADSHTKGGNFMSTRTKATLLTVLLAVPAFLLGPVIWSPAPELPEPSSGQIPFFLVLGVVEALVFGLGVSFLLFGWRAARRAGRGSRGLLALVCITWLLVNWWPHVGFHVSSGNDLQALLFIEYGFHVTLMAAGVVLAYFFLTETVASARPTVSQDVVGDGSEVRGATSAR